MPEVGGQKLVGTASSGFAMLPDSGLCFFICRCCLGGVGLSGNQRAAYNVIFY